MSGSHQHLLVQGIFHDIKNQRNLTTIVFVEQCKEVPIVLFRLLHAKSENRALRPPPPPVPASLFLSSSHVTVSRSIYWPPGEINDILHIFRKSAKNLCLGKNVRTNALFKERVSKESFSYVDDQILFSLFILMRLRKMILDALFVLKH
jgi:hypothetical protein